MMMPVGGIDNQTVSIKTKVAAGLEVFEKTLNDISYFIIDPKEIPGEDLIRHMVHKKLNKPMIKLHYPSV